MPTGTAGTAARNVMSPVVQTINTSLAYNTTGAATGILVGTLPAGAMLTGWAVHVTTAFNAGSTNPIAIGTTGTGTDVVPAASITSGTAGVYGTKIIGSGARGRLAADTAIYVNYIPTGTAASTGAAVVAIEYIVMD